MEYKTVTISPAKLGGKCGFCAFGNAHQYCPSATLSGDGTRALRCECGCQRSRQVKCFTCDLREDVPKEIDPLTWRCLDQDACAARIETRLSANPAIQQLRQIRLDLDREDGSLPTRRQRVARVSRETVTGSCLHCGEPTKGGKFLPGHDAAWLANLVKAAQEDLTFDLQTTRDLIKSVSEHLLAKFDKRVHA